MAWGELDERDRLYDDLVIADIDPLDPAMVHVVVAAHTMRRRVV